MREYRWVRLELRTTTDGHAWGGSLAVLAGSAPDIEEADRIDSDLLDVLLGRGAPWPSPLPAGTLHADLDAAGPPARVR